jgi:hypothetical protein
MSDLMVLNSRITIESSLIGNFQFSGIHEVRIKKSIHSLRTMVSLTLPSIACYIPANKSMPITVTLGEQFQDRDPIKIELAYNGQWQTEFSGFVKRRDLDMPLVVECEGYEQILERDLCINANFSKKPTTARGLLSLLTVNKKGAPTGIFISCPIDFPMTGFRLVNADGMRICDYIKEASDHTLSIFFIRPNVLWCGLVYTAYAAQSTANVFSLPTVNYRIGWNTPKDNQLKEKIPSQPVQIIMKSKATDGSKIFGASATQVYTAGKTKYENKKLQRLVNHVPDNGTVKQFAQEKAWEMNYVGYEGKLTGFLQPFALPGYDAVVNDKRYPELNGTYLIESTDVSFGVKGARRVCEIGPRVGFVAAAKNMGLGSL